MKHENHELGGDSNGRIHKRKINEHEKETHMYTEPNENNRKHLEQN